MEISIKNKETEESILVYILPKESNSRDYKFMGDQVETTEVRRKCLRPGESTTCNFQKGQMIGIEEL